MCFMPTIATPCGAPLYTRTSGLQPCYHAATGPSIASFFRRIRAARAYRNPSGHGLGKQ